jgi:hypothetical protein
MLVFGGESRAESGPATPTYAIWPAQMPSSIFCKELFTAPSPVDPKIRTDWRPTRQTV